MKRSSRPRATAELPKTLHEQLNMYALSAGAAGVGLLALAQPAEAKIVYTRSHRVIGINQHFNLGNKLVDTHVRLVYYCVYGRTEDTARSNRLLLRSATGL